MSSSCIYFGEDIKSKLIGMKKLFFGSIALTVFSISMVVFQMSCKKEAVAQSNSNYTLPTATTSTLGGVIIGSGLNVTSNGTLSVNTLAGGGLQQLGKILYQRYNETTQPISEEYWTANYDGTNQAKIPITLPAGLTISNGAFLSPDGQFLIFGVGDVVYKGIGTRIYKCKLDGSGLSKIVDNNTVWENSVIGAY